MGCLRHYLCFGQTQRRCHFESFRSRQILVDAELTLKFQQLLTGEGSARASRLAPQKMLLVLLNC
jgi:hypothetical protein